MAFEPRHIRSPPDLAGVTTIVDRPAGGTQNRSGGLLKLAGAKESRLAAAEVADGADSLRPVGDGRQNKSPGSLARAGA
jgi:hypothetical protein